MSVFLWIGIGAAVLVAGALFVYYNRFAVLGNRIENSLSQINVQLKRRADLIPNLIERKTRIIKIVEILKKYNVNVNYFIRQSIKEKIQKDWKNIKLKKEKINLPF